MDVLERASEAEVANSDRERTDEVVHLTGRVADADVTNEGQNPRNQRNRSPHDAKRVTKRKKRRKSASEEDTQ